MRTKDSNREAFIFKMGRFAFECTRPGKETRKTVTLVGVIILMILLAIGAVLYFLKVNVLSTALFTGCAMFLGSGIKKPKDN